MQTATPADVEIVVDGEMDDQEDIVRCIRNLSWTMAGTVPLDRDFGIDVSTIRGMPMEVAKNLLAIEIITKIEKYEKRASVKEIDMTSTEDGRITVKMVITSA